MIVHVLIVDLMYTGNITCWLYHVHYVSEHNDRFLRLTVEVDPPARCITTVPETS